METDNSNIPGDCITGINAIVRDCFNSFMNINCHYVTIYESRPMPSINSELMTGISGMKNINKDLTEMGD